MSNILKNPNQIHPISLPDAKIFLFGRGKVSFSWRFTRFVPFWFLYYNSEPGACLTFDDCILRPKAGEILLIPPYTRFSSCCESAFEHLYIHFTVGRPYSQVIPGPMVFNRSICGDVLKRLQEPESPPSAAIYAFLFSALAAIPANRFATSEHLMDDRIQRAIGLLDQGIGNGELCRVIGMSSSNFQRCFKRETGFSPKHYAMELRLENARSQLLSSNDSIPQIAASQGFSDRYAFSKAFKKYTGSSPAQYRLAQSRRDHSPSLNCKQIQPSSDN